MEVTIRILDAFPEPELTALRAAAFADFGEESKLLAEVLADESERRSRVQRQDSQFQYQLRVGAFVENRLVGWSYSQGEEKQLHMINAGVLGEFRGRGIYSDLVKATLAHAETNGFLRIVSRHVPSNNAVIIPKLRLGFVVSAFEYSEVYGPLVHLTYLVGQKRRELYRVRSTPIMPGGNIR